MYHNRLCQQDLDPEKTSKGIVTFFAAVSPAEKLDTPPAISVEDSHAIEMTEAVIIDDRPNPNKTEAPENRTNHTVVKRHVSLRVKRSDEEVDEDDEGQLPINPDDDDGFVDIEDDAPYEFIQSPDDHDDITVDPNDVVEQTEDAGEHDDNDHPHDEDANAVLDVSDDLESDDPAVFHTALPPVQEITVHKNTKLVNKPKKSRHTFHDRSAPKESVQFKVHQTDHSTVTRPKAKHSQYRHQDIYDINWAGRHKRPTYERNSQKTFTSHPSASQLLSPQTSQGFVVKRDPGSAEGVDHHKKIRTNEKARTDVRYSRTTPTVRKKETSVLAIDESYKSRGMKPPRWSSSFIRFEEPDSPLLSSGFGEHLPSDPVDDHPISFPNEEIAEPTISALGLPYASTARPSLSSTPAYNPGRNFPEKEDAKMKRITDEIDKILMENFDFRSTFNSPRKSYHPNRLPPQVSDRESQLDEPESEKVDETGDNRQRRPNDEENEEETTKEQRKEGEDVGEHEDAPPKRDEEESTAKNEEGTKGEKQNNGNGGASVEQQEEAPPQKEDRENADEGEHESTTTESNGVTGGETTDRGNDNSGVEDPRTDRGPVRFQVADVREDNPTKKKTKMKCIPVSEEESVTEKETVVKEEDGKENAAVEEDKGSAVDGETKEPERVQEDVQTEDPETNERTTVKQDEESDKREEEKSNIEDGTKHDGESDRKEEEAPEDGSKHDEEPESKIEKVVQKEEGPTPEERLERKEEASIKKSPSRDDKPNTEGKKTDVENASLHDDKPRKEDEKSNIEHLKVKPKEEKDEYFSEEYSRKGGHDYQDFQSHRHKETDNQLHKHHGREEGGHDHQQKHENSHNKHDQGSKLKGRNQGASGEFQNQHLGDQQSQLQNEDHARQESYGERYRTTDKEQEDNLKKQDDSKYERNKNYRQSGKHLGTNSVDKIPIIEIFHGVPNVAYSEHSNYLDQPNRVTSTTHETPYTSPYSFSTTPNPNQLRVETNRQESPVRSHLSLHPNPRQQSYELPNSTPPGSLISTVANHLPITSTTLPFTTQEHLLTTTPNHQPIAASTPNPPTTTLHDHLVITTHDHLPLISTQDSLLTTTTPHDHLLSTTPNHLITSTPLEVRVSFQEDPIATTHQPRQIEATESEHISTTTASSKIIGLLDKQRNTQHNELEKQREDADYQLNKQKKQLNQDIEGLNPANLVSPETSATDKRNKQQLDWQDYQQQLYYPKPSPKPQGFPPFITVESGKRRPPILVEDVDYRELMDIRDQRVVHSNQDSELDRPTGRYYV